MGDFVFSIKHLCTCTGMSKVRTLTIMGALFLTFSCTQNKSVQDPIQSVTFTVNGEDFEMIQIQGGTFMMDVQMNKGVIVRTMKSLRIKKLYLLFTWVNMRSHKNCGKP